MPANICSVKDTWVCIIQGKKTISARATASILGMKASVISLMDVTD